MANNPFQGQVAQNIPGGLLGGVPGTYPTPSYEPFKPAGPTWDQVFYFQRMIMDLQQEVIRLQRDLDKIKNTKEWLVGPESDTLSGIGAKQP